MKQQTNSYEWLPFARCYDPIRVGSIDATDTEPHDHGIVRALNATYRPNKGVQGDSECTLFVGRLNYSTHEDHLKNLFSKYGQIKQCRLVRDFITGFSRGYGFVEFVDKSDAKYAASKLNRTSLDDKTIIVMFECERTLEGWIPRRLGGGFGGKKESGQLRFGGVERPFRRPILVPSTSKPSVSGPPNYVADKDAGFSGQSSTHIEGSEKDLSTDGLKQETGARESSRSRYNERARCDGRSQSRNPDSGRHSCLSVQRERDYKSDRRSDVKDYSRNTSSRRERRIKEEEEKHGRSRDSRERRRKRSRSDSRGGRPRRDERSERRSDNKRHRGDSDRKPEKKKFVRSQLSLTPD